MLSYKYFLSYFVFCFTIQSNLLGQEKFLLTKEEMLPEYQLVSQYTGGWSVAENKSHAIIEQIWRKNDDWKTDIYIDYCQFENELDALNGTQYRSKDQPAIFMWGSQNGVLYGDLGLFHGENFSDGHLSDGIILFTRGNLGISIAKVFLNDRNEFTKLTRVILDKIDANLSEEVKVFENNLREKQFPTASFDTITNSVLQSNLKNYSLVEKWDSKWLTEQNEVKMGIRKTWKNEDSSVVVIDLCKFDTEQFAKSASEIRASYGPHVWNGNSSSYEYYNLDSVEEVSSRVKSIISQDSSMNVKTTSYSFAGSKGNMAVHVHFYNPKGINADTVYSVVKTLAGDIINF